MPTHAQKVQAIRNQVKKFYKQKKKFRIYHGTTTSTRTQKFKKNEIVDTSNLNEVIQINQKENYAVVEPNISLKNLVKATLGKDLMPPVIMELPGITVGGAIQGGAGESSSFKYGGFHDFCLEYEVVLGNGEIVRATPRENYDLFWGTACSYGSLGIITKVKLKLVPVKNFVKLTYYKTTDYKETIDLIKKLTTKKIDFIDGILFSKTLGVVMAGVFSDKTDLPISTFSKATDEWFYLHVEKIVKKNKRYEELIPIMEYLFRYDRGTFWTGRYVFKRGHIPFNRITRTLLNPIFKSKTAARLLQEINISQRYIVQDICLPYSGALPFLDFSDKELKIHPIWLLPGIHISKFDKLSPAYLNEGWGIDVGIYEGVNGSFETLKKLNKRVEKMTEKFGGRKTLYAHQYYTKDEFWRIYDKKWYDNLRKKYYANEVFPDIYTKTYVSERYEPSVLKGLWNVIKSPFKLPIN